MYWSADPNESPALPITVAAALREKQLTKQKSIGAAVRSIIVGQ